MVAYKFRFSSILEDLKDNPLVPKEFKAKLDTLWLLDIAGNDEEFSEEEKEFLLDLANSFVLPMNTLPLFRVVENRVWLSGLPVKTVRRY